MLARSQRRIVVEKASYETWRILSLVPIMMSKIQLAVLISPSAGLGRSDGCRAMWRFCLVDQSRIAGVCREISLFRF
jgi:hypothetical protein